MPSSDNKDELPSVDFSVNLDAFEKVRATAQALSALGMPEAAREYEMEFLRAKEASKLFIRNIAAD